MEIVVVVPAVLRLVKLCVIGLLLIVQGSAGYDTSPSPEIFSEIPPLDATSSPFRQRNPFSSNTPSSEPQPNGNVGPPLPPLPALPPLVSAPEPQRVTGVVPSQSPSSPLVTPPQNIAPAPLGVQGTVPPSSPSIPTVSPPSDVAPPPLVAQGHGPPVHQNASPRKAPVTETPVSVPAKNPSRNSPQISPVTEPSAPKPSPMSGPSRNVSFNVPPPPRELGSNQPAQRPIAPPAKSSISPVPLASPTGELPIISPAIQPIMPGQSPSTIPGSNISHTSSPPPGVDRKNDGIPVAAPPAKTPMSLPPISDSPSRAQNARGRHTDAPVPSFSSPKFPPKKGYRSPAASPPIPSNRHNHVRSRSNVPAPGSSYEISPPWKQQGPATPPSFLPASRHTHYASSPISPGSSASASHSPFSKPVDTSPAPSPSQTAQFGWETMPVSSPKVSPGSSSRIPKTPLLPPLHAFPPPPPNEDCSATVCTEPYTNTPPGSPCGCVLPMQVGLRLSVALYTFFPLVLELAQEIASGVFMKQCQVRIIGANAGSQQPEKTIVLTDLVPLGQRFDNTTAYLTYQRFWHKQVVINASLFGDYEVLYVRYQGLPPSPPTAPSGISIVDGPYSGNENNARTMKPLGVDVGKKLHKNGLGGSMIAIIALSGAVALVLCSAVAWFLLSRHRDRGSQQTSNLQSFPPSVPKQPGNTTMYAAWCSLAYRSLICRCFKQRNASHRIFFFSSMIGNKHKFAGGTGSMVGSGLSSASLSFGSSIATYTGSAKTFSASDIERATNNFDSSRILGEGGFGRVYSGILEDGTRVAVKVLKRDDQQGGREFLAEIEMLSRLHHRNLVKLIGICTEERARCLVYELIPNGSVESHLHGVDKESDPLDWDARIKIALGAARGLAYLHEDSSPRVIHRDFKASNILLEHDFTPKVSDFGLARTALDEENRHISTRVMGTFGYVAPEYAMTGHLLVKSDVYSYGVVLLELLTGRKPVDMSQPPGQENLVAWARPLLTSTEGLKIIIDPSLGPDVPFDSVAKVAAIASMCVQPEVSHRPFMGEVVQALKLVCNECDEAKEVGSGSSSEDLSVDMDDAASSNSGLLPATFQDHTEATNYDSEPDIERGLSMEQFFSSSARYGRKESRSLRRCSSSGPLTTGRGKQLWQGMRRLKGESVSEHGSFFRLWPGSH
ncbi:hypothetical protein Tsubulata_010626 [Turnera subulata]|uniref:Protein kinase domain-containing protein n=1 Tax=Turnera subulata TaxID=218843 RepID=A0A9Q0FIP6_9ROSI|nr:hypothetical protein Tsubulata_010626 [Turnera subulata]